MTKPILTVADLSKAYRIYNKPSDRLWEILSRRSRHTVFESLRDITFSLNEGDSLGLVGQNGAGKSTLLKLLADTLTPTTGVIHKTGNTAALLELGAGFHPDFTGRQNIRLNASLLGLSEDEIEEKESEIIEFSELNDFIDRPVKTYSSGMYVRLGFSIATSVNPKILIVDEALSVGDINFQKKCVKRILDFQKSGTSILFCSHNLHQVQEVCNKSIWIDKGEMKAFGTSNEVVGHYLNFLETRQKSTLKLQQNSNNASTSTSTDKSEIEDIYELDDPSIVARIKEVKILNCNGLETDTFAPLDTVMIEFTVENFTGQPLQLHAGIRLTNIANEVVSISSTKLNANPAVSIDSRALVRFRIDTLPLNFGNYPFTLLIGDENSLVIYDEKHAGVINVNKGRAEYGEVVLGGDWSIETGGV